MKNRLIVIYIKYSLYCLVILLAGCDHKKNQEVITAELLLKMDYSRLFLNADSIWPLSENGKSLREIIHDTGTNDEAKFIASEILFYKDSTFPSENETEILARVYPMMLNNKKYQWYLAEDNRNCYGGCPNTRKNFMSLGRKTLPYLFQMLDSVKVYKDPGRVTDTSKHYVKNIAYRFICNLIEITYEDYEDPAKNDSVINEIKSILEFKYKLNLSINEQNMIIKKRITDINAPENILQILTRSLDSTFNDSPEFWKNIINNKSYKKEHRLICLFTFIERYFKPEMNINQFFNLFNSETIFLKKEMKLTKPFVWCTVGDIMNGKHSFYRFYPLGGVEYTYDMSQGFCDNAYGNWCIYIQLEHAGWLDLLKVNESEQKKIKVNLIFMAGKYGNTMLNKEINYTRPNVSKRLNDDL